jgi:hypothetical protein
MIYEDIVDHNLVLRSQKFEYADFKYLLHGGKESGPLSIEVETSKDGPVRAILYYTILYGCYLFLCSFVVSVSFKFFL